MAVVSSPEHLHRLNSVRPTFMSTRNLNVTFCDNKVFANVCKDFDDVIQD